MKIGVTVLKDLLPCRATSIANCHYLKPNNDAICCYLMLIDAIPFHKRLHEFTPNLSHFIVFLTSGGYCLPSGKEISLKWMLKVNST